MAMPLALRATATVIGVVASTSDHTESLFLPPWTPTSVHAFGSTRRSQRTSLKNDSFPGSEWRNIILVAPKRPTRLFPVLLPETVWKLVFGQVLDQLLVAAFRLLAGGDLTATSRKHVGNTVVQEVKRRLNAQAAKGWAKLCIDPSSYGESEIMRTARGALPAGAATIRNPTPMYPVTALSRPALGPHGGYYEALAADDLEKAEVELDEQKDSQSTMGEDDNEETEEEQQREETLELKNTTEASTPREKFFGFLCLI